MSKLGARRAPRSQFAIEQELTRHKSRLTWSVSLLGLGMILFQAAFILELASPVTSGSALVGRAIAMLAVTGAFFWAWNRRGNVAEELESFQRDGVRRSMGPSRLRRPIANRAENWPLLALLVVPLVLSFLYVGELLEEPPEPTAVDVLASEISRHCGVSLSTRNVGFIEFDDDVLLVSRAGGGSQASVRRPPSNRSSDYQAFVDMMFDGDRVLPTRVVCVRNDSKCADHDLSLRSMATSEVVGSAHLDRVGYCSGGSGLPVLELTQSSDGEMQELVNVIYGRK